MKCNICNAPEERFTVNIKLLESSGPWDIYLINCSHCGEAKPFRAPSYIRHGHDLVSMAEEVWNASPD